MHRTIPDLDYIINAHNFQKIQDCLSEASDMAIVTVDFQGTPVTRHSRCSRFCELVRSDGTLNDLCRKCDSRGGLEAARLGKPYLYQCHMGLLDLAVPLVIEGQYSGAVLAGQVVLKSEAELESLERIAEKSREACEPAFVSKLEELRSMLPVMTRDRVQVIANMLFQITNYIFEEALLKIHLNDLWEDRLRTHESLRPPVHQNLEPLRTVDRALHNSPIVQPAIDYIHEHYDRRISLDEMADLCNISSSYFSKLFNRITGDSFSAYVNQVRVEKARELLETTDTPVTVIALDLGFEDVSYFDKVFKRITGITPTAYKSGLRSPSV